MTFANYSTLAYERKRIVLSSKLFWVRLRLRLGGGAPKPDALFSGQVLDRARSAEARARQNESLLARESDLLAALELLESTRRALFGIENI